jgi:hypothetical protein
MYERGVKLIIRVNFNGPKIRLFDPNPDQLLTLNKVTKITGVPNSVLKVLFYTGLIKGEFIQAPLVYESEIAKIKDLVDKGFQEDNIIYGAKKLGELLEEFGGKKSWGNEFAEILKSTSPDVILGIVKTKIYKKDIEVPIFSKKDISEERIKNFVNSKIAEMKKKKVKIIRSENGDNH